MRTIDENTAAPRPGSRHFASDMGLATLMVTLERSVASAVLGPGIGSPAGGVSLAMLLTLVDVSASSPMLALTKGWTATQDLSISIMTPPSNGPVVADNRVVRVGKKAVVMESDLYDTNGLEDLHEIARLLGGDVAPSEFTPCARAITTFARIPREAASGVDEYDPTTWIGKVQGPVVQEPATGFPVALMGLQTLNSPAGIFELSISPYVANSIGTINGGAQAVMIEAAAEALCPGLIVNDLQVRYLSQLKSGPARSAGRILRQTAGGAVVEVTLPDAGNDNKMLSVATAHLGSR